MPQFLCSWPCPPFPASELQPGKLPPCLALLDVPLTAHGDSETSCCPIPMRRHTPKNTWPGNCIMCLHVVVQVPWTFGKKRPAEKQTAQLTIDTSSNKNCSIEEPHSPLHLRSWSSASNLITHFPTFPIEIHLTCFVLQVSPSFIHRPACWTTPYSVIHPTSLAHLQQIF